LKILKKTNFPLSLGAMSDYNTGNIIYFVVYWFSTTKIAIVSSFTLTYKEKKE